LHPSAACFFLQASILAFSTFVLTTGLYYNFTITGLVIQ
jgi:hypothetical protein